MTEDETLTLIDLVLAIVGMSFVCVGFGWGWFVWSGLLLLIVALTPRVQHRS